MKKTQFPLSIAVNGDGVNGFTMPGAASYDWSGFSVSSAGDINGDSIEDVIIGVPMKAPGCAPLTPQNCNTFNQAGMSYLLFGSPSIGASGTVDLTSFSGLNGFEIPGAVMLDRSGWSVSGVGDINDDGLDDFVIGAPWADRNNQTMTGTSYVIFGQSNDGHNGLFNLTTLNGTNGFEIAGGSSGEVSGYSVSGVGDINHDGIADLIIGAPCGYFDFPYNQIGYPCPANNAGNSYILFGNRSIGSGGLFNLTSLTGSNGFRIAGAGIDDHSGWSVDGVGDINRDGIDDLMIGAPYASPNNRSQAGITYVVFGNSTLGETGTFNLTDLDRYHGLQIWGVGANDRSGWSVNSAGDVNSDGFLDVIIGAPYASPGGKTAAGAAYVVYGNLIMGNNGVIDLAALNGSNGFQIPGLLPTYLAGWSVGSIVDFNGDNITDLIIGAPSMVSADQANPQLYGTTYVLFGSPTIGGNGFFDLTTLNGENGFSSSLAHASIGFSVNGIGDINADGMSDLILGDPFENAQIGASHIYFGDAIVSLTVNNITLSEGQIVAFGPENLNVTYKNFPHKDTSLLFTVSNVQHGGFTWVNNTVVTLSTFLEQDLRQGRVQFVHDGGELAPAYDVSISSLGSASIPSSPQSANVTFINQLPYIVNNRLTLNQGETLILSPADLSATDLDSLQKDPQLLFTISGLQHGIITQIDNPTGLGIFYQSQIQTGNIQFIHDGTPNPPSYQVSVSRGGVTIGPQFANITFNYSPILQNNALLVKQGQPVILNVSDLSATDPDDAAPGLTFIISNVQGGQFALVNNTDHAVMSFTQGQIDTGVIEFIPNGIPSAPSYWVAVSDGKMSTPARAASITFDAAPLFNSNRLTVTQGQVSVLTPNDLSASDLETPAGQLVFTASNVQHGYFALNNNLSQPILMFPQQNILNGQIGFVPDGSTLSPAYQMVVIDSAGLTAGPSTAQVTFISVDSAPVNLVRNELIISEGQTIVLTQQNLNMTYFNYPSRENALLYTIGHLQHGTFTLINNPIATITSFLAQNLDQGQVQFNHDGGELMPVYEVSVTSLSTGNVLAGPQSANVTFVNQLPIFLNNTLILNQGDVVTLDSQDLSAMDPDHPQDDSILLFTLSNVQHGLFTQTNAPFPLTFFYQAQVESGSIQFIHDGTPHPPSYQVSVGEGGVVIGPQAATVIFNYSPVIVNNQLFVKQGQPVILSADNINATDPDDPVSGLTFIVSNVRGGQFVLTQNSASQIASFSPLQVDKGEIEFIPDGLPTAPSYFLAVSDSKMITPPRVASITFDAAPVITSNRLAITQGQSVVLSSSDLSATDLETPSADLMFVTSNIQHGYFAFVNDSTQKIVNFSQQSILNHAVQFISDGSDQSPAYAMTVIDSVGLTAGPQATQVSFNRLPPETATASFILDVKALISTLTPLGSIGLALLGIWLRSRAITKTWKGEKRYAIHKYLREELKLEIGRVTEEKEYITGIYNLVGGVLDIPFEEKSNGHDYSIQVGDRVDRMDEKEQEKCAMILRDAIRQHVRFPKLYTHQERLKDIKGVRPEMPIYHYFNFFIPNPLPCLTTYEFRADVLAAAFDLIVATAKIKMADGEEKISVQENKTGMTSLEDSSSSVSAIASPPVERRLSGHSMKLFSPGSPASLDVDSSASSQPPPRRDQSYCPCTLL